VSTRHLEKMFQPRSVAVVGASNDAGSVGALVMRNLLQGGFDGPIMPVNPKHNSVAGVIAYGSTTDLPTVPDLAVVCTPPNTVPEIVETLGGQGTRAVVVLTAGLGRVGADAAGSLSDDLLARAREHDMRILGPNCLGLLVPGSGLNASFVHLPSAPGRIAFASQSGALCTAVLDWAVAREIGFSHFISMGDAIELDFGDVLDYLAVDPSTDAILLYIESIRERRDFMSAARAAARSKPVIVIKAGRDAEGARAAHSHTGALAGSDAVFDAAIRRAGMLRVHEIENLFAAVETLARLRPRITPLDVASPDDRLAIVTNGGGLGVLAVDALSAGGGRLATLSPETIAELDRVLPPTWSRANPVDIIGDAPGSRYRAALDILLGAPGIDAVLTLHAPTATADTVDAARAVIEAARQKPRRPLLTAWVGGQAVAPARDIFEKASIASYTAPAQAVRAFLAMVEYRRNQEMLIETPRTLPAGFAPDRVTARRIINTALADGQTDVMLGEADAKMLLAAYDIPVVETRAAADPEQAAAAADEIGYPVALKVQSPDISHKSDVGGVQLHLASADEVVAAARTMIAHITELAPDARMEGFTVQSMALRPGAHELIVGVATDPIFGPVILFGQGGTAVEVVGDRAVALPPLNTALAHEQIKRTRIFRLLEGYRDRPAADLDAIALTLIQVSQIVIDLPEVVELDINPVLADAGGVVALDARIRLTASPEPETTRLAIRPYPESLEETARLKDGDEIVIRPIRPEDEPAHYDLLSSLSAEDSYFRFFGHIGRLPHHQMARFTQIDYAREMAFIAVKPADPGAGRAKSETLGVVRAITDSDNQTTEFAIVVRSDMKRRGLGRLLMGKIVAYSRSRGTARMIGSILRDNRGMLALADAFGFRRRPSTGKVVDVELPL